MTAPTSKLIKPLGEKSSDVEQHVSNALAELEMNADIKTQLRELFFVGAKEIELSGKKIVIIFVPVPQLKAYQKVQPRLVRELEKKFSGKHVVFLAKRRILPKPKRGKNRRAQKQKRPRSRTLTSVHDAILADLVFPAEIVGKRTRVKLDGSRLIKVHLDKTQQTNVEHKTDTFAGVYKHMTGKDVVFEFPDSLF